MGEIANDMIEGRCCELCGMYFINPKTGELYEHGYPVTCWSCYEDLTKEGKKFHDKAKVDTL